MHITSFKDHNSKAELGLFSATANIVFLFLLSYWSNDVIPWSLVVGDMVCSLENCTDHITIKTSQSKIQTPDFFWFD